jgi:hypothetical protein
MKFLSATFTLVGLILIAIAINLIIQEIDFLQKAQTASGKVIDLGISVSSSKKSGNSTTYYPIVTFYTKAGQKYTFSSGFSSNPPAYSVGEEVTVYYLPESPDKAEIKGFLSQWFSVLICSIMGIVFGSIGISGWAQIFRKKKKYEWLQKNGSLIQTSLQTVEINSSLKINGKSPYIIYSQWLNPANSKVHVFKSDHIFFNPTQFIPGNTIQVRVDPNNFKKYQMDTSFLPVLN